MKHLVLAALLATLVFLSVPATAQELVTDGGFEGGYYSEPGLIGGCSFKSATSGQTGPWIWSQSVSTTEPITSDYCLGAPYGDPAHAGQFYAMWSATSYTGMLAQDIMIPPNGSLTLSFWTYISSSESGSGAYDTMGLSVGTYETSGSSSNYNSKYDIKFSNLDAGSGWIKHSYDVSALSAYSGKKMRFLIIVQEDSDRPTVFRIDDISLISSASAPTYTYTYVLPSSAHSSGANGAFYTTDLSISNRGTTPANIDLKFIGNNQDGRNATKVARTLAAGQSTTYTDILSSVFGVSSGWGGVIVTSDSSSLKILGQTSTPPPDGKGTFGQSVPGMTPPDFATSSNPLSLISIRQDSDYHTNLVLTNVSDVTAAVTVQVLNSAGAVVMSIPVTLLPESTTQLSAFAPSGMKDGVALVSTTTAGAQVATYAVVIDNVTNDPRTILP